MAYLQWNEDLAVGISDIDEQHRKLIDLINALHEAMLEGRGKAVLGATIDALMDYTVTHFSREEYYFDSLRYPDTVSHKDEHHAFVTRVSDFKRGFDDDRLMLSLEIMDFLSDWLVNHIKSSDKAFGPFLTERGVA